MDILSADLLFRRIKPGEPLREAELCVRFNVSRPAVREALNQLALLGLIDNTPRKGARAVDFSPEELEDVVGFHGVVFAHACRLAAERRSEEELHEIGEAVDHLTRLADSDASAEDYEAARIECYGAIERAIGPAYRLNRRRGFMTPIWNPYAINAVATRDLRIASARRWKTLHGLIAARNAEDAQKHFFAMVEATRPFIIEACRIKHQTSAIGE